MARVQNRYLSSFVVFMSKFNVDKKMFRIYFWLGLANKTVMLQKKLGKEKFLKVSKIQKNYKNFLKFK